MTRIRHHFINKHHNTVASSQYNLAQFAKVIILPLKAMTREEFNIKRAYMDLQKKLCSNAKCTCDKTLTPIDESL